MKRYAHCRSKDRPVLSMNDWGGGGYFKINHLTTLFRKNNSSFITVIITLMFIFNIDKHESK